jgi:hypothetical protein
MTTFTTADREEEENYLRLQNQIQQREILRLQGIIGQVEKERDAYLQAYNKLLEDEDVDGRC